MDKIVKPDTVLDALNIALHHALESDEQVYILGEDIIDPYGGAFKVTRGLSSKFPDRVLSTPISEAGIVGIAAGMAMRGLRPVVEIMFGDFTTLIVDQIINHITKFPWMYNGQVTIPIVIRTPMGGGRGYGPTHSQTLEKLFFGVPGLRVLAPCTFSNLGELRSVTDRGKWNRIRVTENQVLGGPGTLLAGAILDDDGPVLFVENKLLYACELQTQTSLSDFTLTIYDEPNPDKLEPKWILSSKSSHKKQRVHLLGPNTQKETFLPTTIEIGTRYSTPTYCLVIKNAPPPAVTIVSYGYMAELVREAALDLAYEAEIFTELIIPTQIAPITIDPILESTHRTNRLLVVEEGTLTLGWGAEIITRVVGHMPEEIKATGRVAAKDFPIPASGPLEKGVLPGIDDVIRTVREMVNRRI